MNNQKSSGYARLITPFLFLLFVALCTNTFAQEIVFASNSRGTADIWVMNSDGTNQMNVSIISHDPNNLYNEDGPRWKPDGSQIAFVSNKSGCQNIWIMNTDGTNDYNLTNTNLQNSDPCWSPDGTKIYYTRNTLYCESPGSCAPCQYYEIYVYDLLSNIETRLTNNDFREMTPIVSPDGASIAYAKAERSLDCCNQTDLWIMNSNGSNQHYVIGDPGLYDWPSYWGTNRKILFFKQFSAGETYEVCYANPDGTGMVRLTNDNYYDVPICFSPDGNRILFKSNRNGNYDIWVMNIDGTNSINIANSGAAVSGGDWRSITGPSIRITAPISSDYWVKGTAHDILWTPTNLMGDVTIDLYKGNSLITNIGTASVTQGTYSWTIPSTLQIGNDYSIKVYKGPISGKSNNFSITSGNTPTIQVLAPNGGENWVRGTTEYITWYHTALTKPINIALYKGNILAQNLGTVAADQSLFIWNIPVNLEIRNDYRIRVYQGTIQDYSNNYFSISATTTEGIEVTSPNGGEQWAIGSTHKITWNTKAIAGSVTIELYKSGQFYRKLGTSLAAAKTFSWKIVGTTAPGDDFRIRISRGTVSDTSNNMFSLYKNASSIAFEYRGVSLTDYTSDGYNYVEKSIKKLLANNVNYVAINASIYQLGKNDSEIYKSEQKTASDSALRHVIQACKNAGIKVLLKINVDCLDDTSRTLILPNDINAWFDSYNYCMAQYANIAEQERVDMFSVGTELKLVSKDLEHWKQLIDTIRHIYSGELIYSANWDEYANIPFWDYLDYIGIDAYFPLDKNNDATAEQIKADWTNKNWIANIESFRKGKAKDVIFTEIGYPSVEGGADSPYKYTWPIGSEVRLDLQRNCYEGTIRAWEGKGWFKGMFWWDWMADDRFRGQDSKNGENTNLTPVNKPAWQVLGERYAGLMGLKPLNLIWWGPVYFTKTQGQIDVAIEMMLSLGKRINSLALWSVGIDPDGTLKFCDVSTEPPSFLPITEVHQKFIDTLTDIQNNTKGNIEVFGTINASDIMTALKKSSLDWNTFKKNFSEGMSILHSYFNEFPEIYGGIYADIEPIKGSDWGNKTPPNSVRTRYLEMLQIIKNAISGRRLIVHAYNLKTSAITSNAGYFWQTWMYDEILKFGDYITTNSYDFQSNASTSSKYQTIVQQTITEMGWDQKILFGLSGTYSENAGAGESIRDGVLGYYQAGLEARTRIRGLFIFIKGEVEDPTILDIYEWLYITKFIRGY
jgi:Tol biopolymer transport system component